MSELPPPPTLDDVLAAQRTIRPLVPPSPLYRHAGLCELLGCELWIKHENYLPTGAFKVRGGVNLAANLSRDKRRSGVVTASTGNHGQSIAFAARHFGVRAVVCAPTNTTDVKLAGMRGYGAEVVLTGENFEEARRHAEGLRDRDGMRFISSGNEPLLIAGVATHTLEIFAESPPPDLIIVPLGGGSGAAGCALVAKSVSPRTKVVAVQAAGAPAAMLTWRDRTPRTAPIRTAAAGLATGESFELPQRLLQRHLDDCLLVEDDELFRAVRLLLEHAKTLAEPAGASPLAAALRMGESLRGRRVVLILSGGNISPAELRRALDS
ncbi:MAG: threonine ammonia-lyase [Pirellula sp.]|nr:threonine ammonia-lyase [Pirellula sp.]